MCDLFHSLNKTVITLKEMPGVNNFGLAVTKNLPNTYVQYIFNSKFKKVSPEAQKIRKNRFVK